MRKHPDVVAGSVVVVEDEPLIRMWVADVLEAAGYEVKTAGNAEEGIEHLKSVPHIHVLVTDADLPGSLNGNALAWKTRCCHPEARLLVVSGQVRPKSGDLPPGAKFLAKPVQPEVLVRAVRE